MGKVLNLFAGRTRLNVDEYRVDCDPAMQADFHGDAYTFVKNTDMKLDTIILDPPYNIRQAREKHEGRCIGSLTKTKNALLRVLNDNGRAISMGYDTTGMSQIRGFHKLAICVICHSGRHNDTLAVVEQLGARLRVRNY